MFSKSKINPEFIAFLVFVFLIIIGFFYMVLVAEGWLQPTDKQIANKINCERVLLNNSESEVLLILGQPDTIYYLREMPEDFDKAVMEYYYEPPPGASSGIMIYFDSTRIVIRKNCAED